MYEDQLPINVDCSNNQDKMSSIQNSFITNVDTAERTDLMNKILLQFNMNLALRNNIP